MNPMAKVLNNLGGKEAAPVDHPTIPVLASLKANKSGLQLIIHLLAEWNNIEISQITKKKCLIADLTLLWSQLCGPDQQLNQLWHRLITKFRDELNLRWEQAIGLRTIYEDALGDTLEHLKPESYPIEDDLVLAAEVNDEARREASRKHHKRERSNLHSPLGFNSGSANNSVKQMRVEKPDFVYRQKNARLNSLRRQFLKDVRFSYPLLIEEQHDLAQTVKNCVIQHSMARNKLNCQLSRSNSNLTSSTSWISPFKLSAHLQEKLQCNLRLPRYQALQYYDPRETAPRSRVLFGAELDDEEDLDNGMLLVLLQAARVELPLEKGKENGGYFFQLEYLADTFLQKSASPEDTIQLALHLEACWGSKLSDNVNMVLSKPWHLRHSLIMFYLSSLPTPLLPISTADFTQFALNKIKVKEILKHTPYLNLGPLRELCDYIEKVSKIDDRLCLQAGKQIARVKSDLMGDGSNEKTVDGLMRMLIRHFKREKERTILDISPISGTWGSSSGSNIGQLTSGSHE